MIRKFLLHGKAIFIEFSSKLSYQINKFWDNLCFKNLLRSNIVLECERKLQEAEDVFKMKLQDKIDGMQKLLERESQRCQVLFETFQILELSLGLTERCRAYWYGDRRSNSRFRSKKLRLFILKPLKTYKKASNK